jgi:hypothetical protein
MWVYLIISLIITSGLYFERYLVEPYKYLLISPSFYNYPYLNWTTSVWGSFLGIHGTIAVLSITFMGMFVGQVSTSSEYGFESLSKVLLLREYQFLEFSIQSVSSLLCGLFLLLTGSGLLGYFVSACLSLYFIIRYGMMYFRLYNLTEKPEIINGVLFDAIQKTGEKYKEINMQQQKLNDDFSHLIVGKIILLMIRAVYWKDDAISLNVSQVLLMLLFLDLTYNIRKTVFKNNKLNQHPHPIIYFHISFLAPLSNSIIKIIPPENTKMADKFVSEIEEILKKHLSFSSTPYIWRV